jgi:hypothetical protein
MKTQEHYLKEMYKLGFKAGRAISLFSGILIGFIIAIGLFNYYL